MFGFFGIQNQSKQLLTLSVVVVFVRPDEKRERERERPNKIPIGDIAKRRTRW